MTPVSLNPPGPNSLLQGQNQFFNVNQDSTPTLFNLLGGDFGDNHHHQDYKIAFNHDGSSSSNHQQQVYNSSSESVMVDSSSARDTNLSSSMELEDSSKNNGHGSEKWLMNKIANVTTTPMMKPNNDKAIKTTTTPIMRSPRSNNSGNNTVRVCSDCNTTSTPLWRSGPMGPKSLCNACGIRQRKARRAMAEAANGLATSSKSRVHKEKKPGHFLKIKIKSIATTTSAGSSSQDVKNHESYALNLRKNSDFESPYDEVATAAGLLMDISAGVTY